MQKQKKFGEDDKGEDSNGGAKLPAIPQPTQLAQDIETAQIKEQERVQERTRRERPRGGCGCGSW